jgi:RimJ/RimL family protein N-acetyltransferase
MSYELVRGRTVKPDPIINIHGQRVGLGPIHRECLTEATRWVNDFATIRTMGAPPRPISYEWELEWFEEIRKSETDIVFVIYRLDTMELIGSAGLHQINWRHRTAEFGILIGESRNRGQGFGTEVTKLILQYAFRHLGLLNIMLKVASVNESGIAAYRKAGFQEFGRRRGAWFIEGQRYDMVMMDCVPDDIEDS